MNTILPMENAAWANDPLGPWGGIKPYMNGVKRDPGAFRKEKKERSKRKKKKENNVKEKLKKKKRYEKDSNRRPSDSEAKAYPLRYKADILDMLKVAYSYCHF